MGNVEENQDGCVSFAFKYIYSNLQHEYPHFELENWKFCGFELEPPRRGGSNAFAFDMFWDFFVLKVNKTMHLPLKK